MTAPARKLSILLALAICIAPGTASATPANKQAFSRYFGKYLPQGLDTCAVCHIRAEANGAESLDDFPHNPFGDRLRIAAESLEKENRNTGIRDRLILVADEDADGDDVSILK
jgi:mono/diheme cytochrome c family protein